MKNTKIRNALANHLMKMGNFQIEANMLSNLKKK